MKLKNVISKLWVKHIRLRFARVYTCHNCSEKYLLHLNQLECPTCGDDAVCLNPELDPESSYKICGCFLEINGKCVECDRYNKLGYIIWNPLNWTKQFNSNFPEYFEINKHDQWIGHYYKTENKLCESIKKYRD